MELNLALDNRNLKFSSTRLNGEGLDDLIKNLKAQKVDKIVISGESKSYTFLRQVALFVNILVKTQKTELCLASKSFKIAEGSLFPIYE